MSPLSAIRVCFDQVDILNCNQAPRSSSGYQMLPSWSQCQLQVLSPVLHKIVQFNRLSPHMDGSPFPEPQSPSFMAVGRRHSFFEGISSWSRLSSCSSKPLNAMPGTTAGDAPNYLQDV